MRQRLGILPRGARSEERESRKIRHSPLTPRRSLLLLLFRVHRVLAEARAELLELQLLAARLATQGVVVITGFLADEVNGFDFLFSFSGHGRVEGSGFGVDGSEAWGP